MPWDATSAAELVTEDTAMKMGEIFQYNCWKISGATDVHESQGSWLLF